MAAPVNPLDALPLTQALHESTALYVAVVTAHLAGVAVLVGTALVMDLRVLGLGRSISVSALSRLLMPWSWGSLVLIVPSGLLLFLANSAELLTSQAFQVKMAILLAAALNAIGFLTGPYQSVKGWDVDASSPLAARAACAASLALWPAAIACGAYLAYA